MADREKVIKGLRCHSEPKFGPDEYFCEACPYDEATCGLDVPNDALSLLKAQEPGWISVKDRLPKGVNETQRAIDNVDSVDAVPVVHGRWVDEDFPDKPATYVKPAICSVCGKMAHKMEHGYNILSKYCPDCGAKMDGDSE